MAFEFPKYHAPDFTQERFLRAPDARWAEAERDFRIGAKVARLSEEKSEKFIALCKDMENVANAAEAAECLAP